MAPGPIKLAIVGAGPSAFYVASRLLSLLPRSHPQSDLLRIHMYDRLWAPHGLVRYGVAPDHPEVKNCTHKFDQAAADPRFRFFGNVNVGAELPPFAHAFPLPLSTLYANYTHLLLATGCGLPMQHPALLPSRYCVPALSLVHWYTQHPSNPPPPPLESIKHVTLVGQGNVALDIARLLLAAPTDLAEFDIPESVFTVLKRSAVRHVSIVGRRGPLQAAFTTKELREMMNLREAAMLPVDPTLLVSSSTTRQQGRTLDLLRQGSKNAPGTTPKTWSFEFFRSPTALVPPPPGSSSTSATLALAHTSLDPLTARAVPTSDTSGLSTDLVITSLGFQPESGALLSTRVIAPDVPGRILENVYASGWAATGARGVLAATMRDAYAVADTILSDWMPASGDTRIAPSSPTATTEGTDPLLQDQQVVMNPEADLESVPTEVTAALHEGNVTEYPDWKAVDAEEVQRGAALGKERERMTWPGVTEFLAKQQKVHSV